MFAIVLAAAAMVSCAGNANKSKAAEEVKACTECVEGKCDKPAEEQCEACKAKAAAEACCEKAAEACEKACDKAEKACEKAAECCKEAAKAE